VTGSSGSSLRMALSEDVARAIDSGGPAVALETSVLAHGLREPHDRRAAEAMIAAIETRGAIPAWTWVSGGALRVGAAPGDLERLMTGSAVKVARRDLPAALAARHLGATTVSGTLWAARAARIEVVATGGVGGVHPGTGDVSADLLELARTPVTLVCSGPKSILDPGATMERLDELGVGVIGYRCSHLPFFLVREASPALEHRADEPGEVAEIVRARKDLGMEAALVVCNPIPEAAALPAEEVAAAVTACVARAEAEGVRGKALTPYLLGCLAERTGGASVEANLALLESNAALAAEVAVAISATTS
jgi:pseudouridine-5'-phosphate glycosidase